MATRSFRFLVRAGILLIALTAVLVAAAFVTLSLADSPTFAWRVLRHMESGLNDHEIFPARPIAAAAVASVLAVEPAPLPETVSYPTPDGPRTERLDDLIIRTGTRAFIVVRDDKVIFEVYPGSSRDAINTSFSSAKSVVSTLIGAAIADGLIGSVDDPVIDYVPELAGRGLDRLTVRDLLLMNTGIRYRLADDEPIWRSLAGDDARSYYAPDLRRVALAVQKGDRPIGAAFYYNNYHMLIEGLILERVTGMPVARYLEQRIWQPMGAEFPASWSLDSDQSGFEKMESGLNARAIDYARFGLVFLHGGYWNGQQILPAEWVREATAPLSPNDRPWDTAQSVRARGGYYKYHWWGHQEAPPEFDFYAFGKYDQVVYVAPRKNVVVVRLGARPDAAVSWPMAIKSLVDAL